MIKDNPPPLPEPQAQTAMPDSVEHYGRVFDPRAGEYLPQAQAGEPEVVAYALGDGLFDTPSDYEHSRLYGTGVPLITMQSHREAMESQRQNFWQVLELREQAIAKKDAALKACVEALKQDRAWLESDALYWVWKENNSAIQQALEALE